MSQPRPASRTAPRIERRYEPNLHRPYAVEFHLDGCECPDCTRPIGTITPELPVAKLVLAGALAGNAIAFLYDWHGALQALASTIGVKL